MKKNILIIAPSDTLPIPNTMGGAIETLTTHLINKNEVYGYLNMHVISPYEASAKTLSISYKHTKIHFIKKNLFWTIISFLLKVIRRLCFRMFKLPLIMSLRSYYYVWTLKPEIILIEGETKQVADFRLFNIPKILHVHTDILNVDSPDRDIVMSTCSRIWVISEYLKKRVEENSKYKVPIDIFRNCIDTNKFKRVDSSDLKMKYNIQDSDIVAIYCGRIHPGKGVKELVEAFKIAQQSNTVLIVVGGTNFADSIEDEYEKTIKEYVHENNLRVIFLGYKKQEELYKYYSMADFSICPSICNEAAGLVIIEARCMGLPVVATNNAGIPEYVNKNSTLLVDLDDFFVLNLSKALNRLFTDTAFLISQKRNAIEDMSGYSIDNYYKNFLNLINNDWDSNIS